MPSILPALAQRRADTNFGALQADLVDADPAPARGLRGALERRRRATDETDTGRTEYARRSRRRHQRRAPRRTRRAVPTHKPRLRTASGRLDPGQGRKLAHLPRLALPDDAASKRRFAGARPALLRTR